MARPRQDRVLFGLPRLDVFEINDQSWWPNFLRARVQDALTLAWVNKFPILQPVAPCDLVARVLSSELGSTVADYVYVDFASGAGGPTPYIEREVNRNLATPVDFVLTDISPHIQAWESASKKSENLHYVTRAVDAAAAPSKAHLLQGIPNTRGKGVMRLFSLAFHHFDDDLAGKILKNTIETSDGFCIFELQQRNYTSLITIFCLWPMLMLTSLFHYPHDSTYMFFTYILPWIPFVVQFDGLMSMLRTRTPMEVYDLLKSQVSETELDQWRFTYGERMHTYPFGFLSYIVCCKDRRQ